MIDFCLFHHMAAFHNSAIFLTFSLSLLLLSLWMYFPLHHIYSPPSTLLQPPHLISPLFFSPQISSASLCFPLLSSSLSFLLSFPLNSSLLSHFSSPSLSSPLLPSLLFPPLLPSHLLSSLLLPSPLFQTTHLTRTSVQYEEKHPLLTWQT